MKVVFFVPPPEQRVGGLDAAITGLRVALERHGVSVGEELPDRGEDCVAHFHGLWQRPHALLSRECRARGIRAVVSPHGMLEPWAWRHKRWKKWPYFHLVEKRHLARAHALLATAAPEAGRLRGFLPGQRIETLPLGLTGDTQPDYHRARAELGWADDERVLLFLSRIHVKKGLDLLLRALTTLNLSAPARLVIVGDGAPAYVAELLRFAQEHAATLPRLDWIGPVWGDARWKYFQGADLFCLPTHSENFGLAVLEACQVGTPALTTTETPWAEELAADRGFICAPRTDAIRRQLALFFSRDRPTSEARRGLADWAHTRFHWDALAGRYLTFYRSLAQ
ncbi:MAG: glycosyltransferase [Chthoniobacter sp.]|nr:glycosyltransferase [Chthoniobacter sp.]